MNGKLLLKYLIYKSNIGRYLNTESHCKPIEDTSSSKRPTNVKNNEMKNKAESIFMKHSLSTAPSLNQQK